MGFSGCSQHINTYVLQRLTGPGENAFLIYGSLLRKQLSPEGGLTPPSISKINVALETRIGIRKWDNSM